MKVIVFWQCLNWGGKEEILGEPAKSHNTNNVILHKRNFGRKESRVSTARERCIGHVDRA